jgi:hypothetical protein
MIKLNLQKRQIKALSSSLVTSQESEEESGILGSPRGDPRDMEINSDIEQFQHKLLKQFFLTIDEEEAERKIFIF